MLYQLVLQRCRRVCQHWSLDLGLSMNVVFIFTLGFTLSFTLSFTSNLHLAYPPGLGLVDRRLGFRRQWSLHNCYWLVCASFFLFLHCWQPLLLLLLLVRPLLSHGTLLRLFGRDWPRSRHGARQTVGNGRHNARKWATRLLLLHWPSGFGRVWGHGVPGDKMEGAFRNSDSKIIADQWVCQLSWSAVGRVGAGGCASVRVCKCASLGAVGCVGFIPSAVWETCGELSKPSWRIVLVSPAGAYFPTKYIPCCKSNLIGMPRDVTTTTLFIPQSVLSFGDAKGTSFGTNLQIDTWCRLHSLPSLLPALLPSPSFHRPTPPSIPSSCVAYVHLADYRHVDPF